MANSLSLGIAKRGRVLSFEACVFSLQLHFGLQRSLPLALMERGSTKVEVAYDCGAIYAGSKSVPVCELEVELISSSPALLCEIARPWVEQYGLWLGIASKAERGEQLAASLRAGREGRRADAAVVHDTAAMLQSIIESCLTQLLPNTGEVAAGSVQSEHVHQARVGLRRLRTALRELSGFTGNEEVLDAQQQEVLAIAFRRLGEVRAQEAVSQVVQSRLAEAGAPPGLHWPWPVGKLHSPDAAVRDTAFQAVLLELLVYTLRDPIAERDCGKGRCAKALQKRLSRLHGQVERDSERLTTLSPEQQHRVRKRLKQLRYLSEFVTPLFGTHAVAGYVQALRLAQDDLGEHNDDVVGLDTYRRATAEQPQAWFAVGGLTAALRASARECQRALRKVAGAPRLWKEGGKPD